MNRLMFACAMGVKKSNKLSLGSVSLEQVIKGPTQRKWSDGERFRLVVLIFTVFTMSLWDLCLVFTSYEQLMMGAFTFFSLFATCGNEMRAKKGGGM